jgi:hypothetical protein
LSVIDATCNIEAPATRDALVKQVVAVNPSVKNVFVAVVSSITKSIKSIMIDFSCGKSPKQKVDENWSVAGNVYEQLKLPGISASVWVVSETMKQCNYVKNVTVAMLLNQ